MTAIHTVWLTAARIDHDALARDARRYVDSYIPRVGDERAVVVQVLPDGKVHTTDWDSRVEKEVERIRRALTNIEKARSKPMGRYRHPLWRAKNRLRIAQIDLNHAVFVRDSVIEKRRSS